ncbi:MAG: hypothetical protein OEN23_07940 [Paracoccaceae bacterium]|nr:hypothetical protein [Paracoccaceae bacterium]
MTSFSWLGEVAGIYVHFERNQKSTGLNGLGEMGTIASMPAIMNAVNDALSGAKVNEIEAPATPDRIWRACRNRM